MLTLAPSYKDNFKKKGDFYTKNHMESYLTSSQFPVSRINNVNQITKFTNSGLIHPELHFMKDSPLPEILEQINKDEIKGRIIDANEAIGLKSYQHINNFTKKNIQAKNKYVSNDIQTQTDIISTGRIFSTSPLSSTPTRQISTGISPRASIYPTVNIPKTPESQSQPPAPPNMKALPRGTEHPGLADFRERKAQNAPKVSSDSGSSLGSRKTSPTESDTTRYTPVVNYSNKRISPTSSVSLDDVPLSQIRRDEAFAQAGSSRVFDVNPNNPDNLSPAQLAEQRRRQDAFLSEKGNSNVFKGGNRGGKRK